MGVTPEIFLENTGANLCTLAHFGGTSITSGHQRWHGKSTLFRITFKSGNEFTVPGVQVPRPLFLRTHARSHTHKFSFG